MKRQLKGSLRRARHAWLPSREVLEYERWIAERSKLRASIYTREPEPGLFSILTAVWDGSPLRYLRELAGRIAQQNATGATEWIVLDNGCRRAQIRAYLDALARSPWIRVVRAETNLGITRGLRMCLEAASGRYVLPVDADDLLDDDALRVVASAAHQHECPPLLYTDEDKVLGARRYEPYRKPDWDPVLLLNSAYIAHLGVIDRERALALGAYTDPQTEGSPDWDLFVRFLIAGQRAVHVPEVVYSWRVHAASTADDDATKSYIAESQRAVLQRFLDSRPEGYLFNLEPSPLFTGGAHWRFRRRPTGTAPIELVRGYDLQQWAAAAAGGNEFVALVGPGIEVSGEDWKWEALGIFELHPQTLMIGGRLRTVRGELLEAGLDLDDDGNATNPHYGKAVSDPGYFGQLWKQRSVGSVSASLAIVRSEFLLRVLRELRSADNFAPSAGMLARQSGGRVVYSPFIEGVWGGGSVSTF